MSIKLNVDFPTYDRVNKLYERYLNELISNCND